MGTRLPENAFVLYIGLLGKASSRGRHWSKDLKRVREWMDGEEHFR